MCRESVYELYLSIIRFVTTCAIPFLASNEKLVNEVKNRCHWLFLSKARTSTTFRMRLRTLNIVFMKYFTKEELGPKFFQIAFLWFLGTFTKSEEHSEPSQPSTMEAFAKIVKDWEPLTIFSNSSVLDVWQGSEYTSKRAYKYLGSIFL